MIHGSEGFKFIQQLRSEYETILTGDVLDESSRAREEDMRARLKEIILAKLSGEELARIVDEHMRLGQALGMAVGIHAGEEGAREKECLLDDDTGMVASRNKDVIFSFLRVRLRIKALYCRPRTTTCCCSWAE